MRSFLLACLIAAALTMGPAVAFAQHVDVGPGGVSVHGGGSGHGHGERREHVERPTHDERHGERHHGGGHHGGSHERTTVERHGH